MGNLEKEEKLNADPNIAPVYLKLLVILAIIGLLLIPNSAIRDLITEREGTKTMAIADITKTWGKSQMIGGPVLSIPYKEITPNGVNQVKTTIKYAHFFPEKLIIDSELRPETKFRGIYKVILYNAKLQISGNFKLPDLSKFEIPKENYLFEKAFLSMGISDLIGIKESIAMDINGLKTAMNPGINSDDIYNEGVSVFINPNQEIKFSSFINVNGSNDISFLPYGKDTHVTLNSNWKDPSFIGAFSPDNKKITKDYFNAQWNVSEFNRNYPQQGLGNFIEKSDAKDGKWFGVKLIETANEYQKTTRSSKYDYLFFILTFTAFFLIEVLNKIKIHPIQYLLVGTAICLFYILLLSISEHLSFNWAYGIATTAILSLILFYTKFVFNNTRFSLAFTSALGLLYGFFFTLLQAENYSLLLGSIGLLIILGLVMYFTRKLDWYNSFKK
jgi:inner membrane protein